MPPKIRITRGKIIEAATDIVRHSGLDALNARAVASALGCSTQPVFSNYPSMSDLKIDVKKAAYEAFCDRITRMINEGRYPVYKSSGMAYIAFAKEEKELFRLLFMSDTDDSVKQSADYSVTVRYIGEKLSISDSDAQRFHGEMWMCVHGMASLVATSNTELTEELCSEMLTDIYLGLVARFKDKAQRKDV